MIFNEKIVSAAQMHARDAYPNESCGIVVGGQYMRCRNIAEVPTQDFAIHPADYKNAILTGRMQAIVHSHPDGPLHPSKTDMESQIKTDVPWAIIPLDEDRMGAPIIWGDDDNIPPLLGREFVPGVTDCFALIRDVFRLGREGCAAQGIEWPLDPILIAEQPRDEGWWASGEDLYIDGMAGEGFVEVPASEIRPGDVFLLKWQSEKFNHGGVLLTYDTIAQHFPKRQSRREPSGLWARHAEMWIRYVGKSNA
ncbi:C40 family peptidase [Pararhizobium qamdonense]|uniref:C40 family peptidase n=1 Tax=Pararhizobium qamdonense TaxID=3031126 RepID=UPI0023E1DBE3|nr:C40 family peptidase [Pararhizobium qamdonense]